MIQRRNCFFKWRQPGSKDEWLYFSNLYILQRRRSAYCFLCAVRSPLYHSQMQREEENEIFLGAAKRIGSYQREGSYLQSQHLKDWGRRIMSLRPAWTTERIPGQFVGGGGGEGVKLEKQLNTPCTGPTAALGCWACAPNLIHAAQSWVTPHTCAGVFVREWKSTEIFIFCIVSKLFLFALQREWDIDFKFF